MRTRVAAILTSRAGDRRQAPADLANQQPMRVEDAARKKGAPQAAMGDLRTQTPLALGSDGGSAPTLSPRSKNNEVQRRFRERQKSRAAALQAQMEELEGEMGVLRLERAALARKSLAMHQILCMRNAMAQTFAEARGAFPTAPPRPRAPHPRPAGVQPSEHTPPPAGAQRPSRPPTLPHEGPLAPVLPRRSARPGPRIDPEACGPRCLGVAVPAGGCLLGADSHEELLALHGAFQAELKIQYERALGGGYPEPALAALATLVDGWAQTFWHLAQTRHELLIGFMTASLPADSRHHQAWPTIAARMLPELTDDEMKQLAQAWKKYVERTTVAAAAMPRWRRRIALLASLDLGTSLHRISRDTDELLNLTGRMQHASEEEFWASMELAASGPYATFPDSWQAYICYWSLPFMPDPVALVFHILRQGQAAGRLWGARLA
uniref:BZIP domain-containing protein n=1 Tax=Auxenochlorella protothecoides TaxID=3075 RepID=A0A1D1ZRV4_AUXPR